MKTEAIVLVLRFTMKRTPWQNTRLRKSQRQSDSHSKLYGSEFSWAPEVAFLFRLSCLVPPLVHASRTSHHASGKLWIPRDGAHLEQPGSRACGNKLPHLPAAGVALIPHFAIVRELTPHLPCLLRLRPLMIDPCRCQTACPSNARRTNLGTMGQPMCLCGKLAAQAGCARSARFTPWRASVQCSLKTPSPCLRLGANNTAKKAARCLECRLGPAAATRQRYDREAEGSTS